MDGSPAREAALLPLVFSTYPEVAIVSWKFHSSRLLFSIALCLGMLMPIAHARNVAKVAAETTVAPLSAAEIEGLVYMREEEKLARDVYAKLYEVWKDKIFYDISLSETRHTNQVKRLLEQYGVPDPAAEDIPGVFQNATLQQMYDDLVVKGSVSLFEGLRVGGLIEETDMRDILAAMEQVTHADILTVYANLLDGSKNHLRAFVTRIEGMGIVYEPQVLSQDEIDAIVN